MKNVLLGLYIVISCIHLYHSFINDMKTRRYSKPVLIFLIAYYIVAAESISWILLFALITSWLGDVLLIPKGPKWFRAGGIAFRISHFLFILVYIPHIIWANVPWEIVAGFAVVYLVFSTILTETISAENPHMKRRILTYMLTNSTMNMFALIQMLSLRSYGAVVAYLGALLFFASDFSLFFVRCYSKPDVVYKRHFTVMLTYLAGELLITLGLLML